MTEPRFRAGDRVRVSPGARVVATFERCAVCGRDHQAEAIAGPHDHPEVVEDTIRIAECCDACWAWSMMVESRARMVAPAGGFC